MNKFVQEYLEKKDAQKKEELKKQMFKVTMLNNAHNSLIVTLSANCTGNRRESFLFVFNSIASLCRKSVAGQDWFVISKIN